MRKNIVKIAVVALCILLMQALVAQERSSQEKRNGVDAGSQFLKANEIMDQHVTNSQGENIGKVEEIMVDVNEGRVPFAVLSFSAFAEMENKLFAMPLQTVQWQPEQKKATILVDQSKLQSAPSFEDSQWSKVSDQQWINEVYAHYNQKPHWQKKDESARHDMSADAEADRAKSANDKGGKHSLGRIEKASEIIGRDIKGQQQESLGKIEELVIDPEASRVAFVISSLDEIEGAESKFFAMPWASVSLRGDKAQGAMISVDETKLATAPSFDKNNWPNISDRTWGKQVYAFYGQKPYWDEPLTNK